MTLKNCIYLSYLNYKPTSWEREGVFSAQGNTSSDYRNVRQKVIFWLFFQCSLPWAWLSSAILEREWRVTRDWKEEETPRENADLQRSAPASLAHLAVWTNIYGLSITGHDSPRARNPVELSLEATKQLLNTDLQKCLLLEKDVRLLWKSRGRGRGKTASQIKARCVRRVGTLGERYLILGGCNEARNVSECNKILKSWMSCKRIEHGQQMKTF